MKLIIIGTNQYRSTKYYLKGNFLLKKNKYEKKVSVGQSTARTTCHENIDKQQTQIVLQSDSIMIRLEFCGDRKSPTVKMVNGYKICNIKASMFY